MAGTKRTSENQGILLLRKDIADQTFRRVYLLFGDEDYLVRQYKHELIRAVIGSEDSMNLNIHRSESLDWGVIQDEIMSMPFFADHRMVVLEDTGLFMSRKSSKAAQNDADEVQEDEAEETSSGEEDASLAAAADLSAQVAAFIPKIPESTVVLFTERPDEIKAGGRKGRVSVDKRGKLYKVVSKAGLAAEFEAQNAQSLSRWVAGKLAGEKIRITSGAMERFLQMTGNDMSHINTETQKLISYAGPGGVIHVADVEAITSEILEGKVFRMIDLITRHECAAALNLYYDLLQLRESPSMIFALIMKQYDRMMLAKDIMVRGGGIPQIMSGLKLADWQARQLMNQARYYTMQQVRDLTEECVRMRQLVQSGRMGEQLAVELIIVKCSSGEQAG